MNKPVSIYVLECPITGHVKYIGQTYVKLQQRLNKHISDSRKPTFKVQCWIKSLVNQGLKPVIREIEQCTMENCDEREIYYIKLFKDSGFDLKNICLGGSVKNRQFSQETKDKISKSLTGRKQSMETIMKRTKTSIETWKNPELRELKRKQSIELNRLGLIGTKGKTSKKKGIPLAEDIKQKIQNASRRWYTQNENYNSKSVSLTSLLSNDVFTFPSMTKACKFLDTTCSRQARECTRGIRESYKGYKIKYIQNESNPINV